MRNNEMTYPPPEPSGNGEGEKEEFFDSTDVLEKKVKHMAKLIKESKHCVFHTGAGISTSCMC
jgi:hypothetical protein